MDIFLLKMSRNIEVNSDSPPANRAIGIKVVVGIFEAKGIRYETNKTKIVNVRIITRVGC